MLYSPAIVGIQPMNAPAERLILEPGERREAVLQVIRGARERLVLSVFRCDDFKILDALAGAVRRNVRVQSAAHPAGKELGQAASGTGGLPGQHGGRGAPLRRRAKPSITRNTSWLTTDPH